MTFLFAGLRVRLFGRLSFTAMNSTAIFSNLKMMIRSTIMPTNLLPTRRVRSWGHIFFHVEIGSVHGNRLIFCPETAYYDVMLNIGL